VANDHVGGASVGNTCNRSSNRAWPSRWMNALAFIVVALGGSMLVMAVAFGLLATLRMAYTSSNPFADAGAGAQNRLAEPEQTSSISPLYPMSATRGSAPALQPALGYREMPNSGLADPALDAVERDDVVPAAAPAKADGRELLRSTPTDDSATGALLPINTKDGTVARTQQLPEVKEGGAQALEDSGLPKAGRPASIRVDPQTKPRLAAKRHPKLPRHGHRAPVRVVSWPPPDPFFQSPTAAGRAAAKFR
jgi:hypothetical protein